MGHTQGNCYSLHGFHDKTTNFSKSEVTEPKFSNEEYQEYLRLNPNHLELLVCQQLAFHNLWKVKILG